MSVKIIGSSVQAPCAILDSPIMALPDIQLQQVCEWVKNPSDVEPVCRRFREAQQ